MNDDGSSSPSWTMNSSSPPGSVSIGASALRYIPVKRSWLQLEVARQNVEWPRACFRAGWHHAINEDVPVHSYEQGRSDAQNRRMIDIPLGFDGFQGSSTLTSRSMK